MNVSDLGEFGLIELLAKIVGQAESKSVLIGIGDDAACWRAEASTQLATTDSLIQDIHFTLSTTTWRELGWKALAISLSDIAAMGGLPQYALVSLGLPGDTEVASIAELYEGMAELARLFDVSIVGGDSVEAPVVMLSLVVIGKAQESQTILTRSAAAPGDLIAVTGLSGGISGRDGHARKRARAFSGRRKYNNYPQRGSPETASPRCRGASFGISRCQVRHRPERRACQ